MFRIPYLTPNNAICKVMISDGIEDGHEVEKVIYNGDCFFMQATKRVQNSEGLWVPLAGLVQIKGDICPDLHVISGTCEVNGSEAFVCRGRKSRNPDGSVHHTLIELGVE